MSVAKRLEEAAHFTSGHTPGPWHAGGIGEQEFEKPGIFTADSHQLADVFVHGGIEQARANAAVMAAAAEMLEALKRVRQAFYVAGTSKALRAAFAGTKELVAKAERRDSV